MKLQRAQKRKACEEEEPIPSPVKTRAKVGRGSMDRSEKCFFCNELQSSDPKEILHEARTENIDTWVRECASILQDKYLIGKLSEGDMHALDAKYHKSCMTNLHNRMKKKKRQENAKDSGEALEGLVMGELVTYINSFRGQEVMPIFKLSNLVKMYTTGLCKLDPSKEGKVNATRLKERILKIIPDLKAQN